MFAAEWRWQPRNVRFSLPQDWPPLLTLTLNVRNIPFLEVWRTYLFASTADKADFDKDPAKYAPRSGGFCAYGVVNGILSNIEGNPDAFAVYKGKLYLCGNQAALRSFRSNIDSNIEKADTNWRQLTGS